MGIYNMAMLNLSEGSSEYRPTSQVMAGGKGNRPTRSKSARAKVEMAERICTTFVDGCVFGEGSQGFPDKNVLYDSGGDCKWVGGGSKFHTHFRTLAQMIFLISEFSVGSWFVWNFKTDSFGKKRSNCWNLLFFRELKCKQCSSF